MYGYLLGVTLCSVEEREVVGWNSHSALTVWRTMADTSSDIPDLLFEPIIRGGRYSVGHREALTARGDEMAAISSGESGD